MKKVKKKKKWLRNQLLLPLTNQYLLQARLNLLELVTAERLVSIYLLSMSAVQDNILFCSIMWIIVYTVRCLLKAVRLLFVFFFIKIAKRM